MTITIDKNTYVIYNIFYNQGVFIMNNDNHKENKENLLTKFLKAIHEYYIFSFIFLFALSIIIFGFLYFLHSKNIENRFNYTLQNYEKSMSTIFNNMAITNGNNESINTNSFQTNNEIRFNNNIENLKLSFEVGFKMLESSMDEIMKNSNDILQFWFAFLSLIMIVFTLAGALINNNILSQSKYQLNIFKNKVKKETDILIEERNKNIKINNLFNLYNMAYHNKNYTLSINYCMEIIELYRLDFENKRYGENTKEYYEAIKNYSSAYTNRGIAKSNLNNDKEAIKDYNKAIELYSNYYQAYYNRALSKEKLQLLSEAIYDYDIAIGLKDNSLEAYNNRGIVKSKLGNYKEAIEDFNKAIELNPNYYKAYSNRADSKMNLEKYEEALKDLNQAIKIKYDYANAYFNIGEIKYKQKKYKEAIKNFDMYIEFNTKDAEAYYKRGEIKLVLAHKNKKEYNKLREEAIKDFITAYELDNNDEIKEKSKNELINLAQKGYNEAREFCKKYNINYNDNKE